jgi:hypothetical protein
MASRGGRIVERTGGRKSAPAGARRRFWLLAAALLLTGVALVGVWRSLEEDSPPVVAEPASEPGAALLAQGPRVPPVRRAAAAPEPESAPKAGSVLPELDFTLPEPGREPSGIALYPPPGTDPPKRGLVVPEGFELPEGYVRHYQATDDGQELPPILMFHPDYEWLDENGEPIEIPADRVVPPELAPAGLPLRQLELPAPKPD